MILDSQLSAHHSRVLKQEWQVNDWYEAALTGKAQPESSKRACVPVPFAACSGPARLQRSER